MLNQQLLISILFFVFIMISFTISLLNNKNATINFCITNTGKFFIVLLILMGFYMNIYIGILFLLFFSFFIRFCGDNIDILDGIDIIYWINLDRATERREKMESLFQDDVFNILEVKRFNAIDGKKVNVRNMINCDNLQITKSECACFLSHMETIRSFSKSRYEVALILEDDISLEYKKYWKNNIKSIIEGAPVDWEIIQLGYTPSMSNSKFQNWDGENDYDITYNNYYGAFAYIINKKAAIKIIKNKYYNKKYLLGTTRNLQVADSFIYYELKSYTYKYPLFTYLTDDNISTIHNNHDSDNASLKQKVSNLYYEKYKY